MFLLGLFTTSVALDWCQWISRCARGRNIFGYKMSNPIIKPLFPFFDSFWSRLLAINRDVIDCCFGRSPVFLRTVKELLVLVHWALPGLQHNTSTCVYTIICRKKRQLLRMMMMMAILFCFPGLEAGRTMPKKWWATSSSPPSTGRMFLK